MPECKTCKHKGINTHICDECASYYSMYEKKIVTNADRIREMNDEELAKIIVTNPIFTWDKVEEDYEDVLNWLQSEAE